VTTFVLVASAVVSVTVGVALLLKGESWIERQSDPGEEPNDDTKTFLFGGGASVKGVVNLAIGHLPTRVQVWIAALFLIGWPAAYLVAEGVFPGSIAGATRLVESFDNVLSLFANAIITIVCLALAAEGFTQRPRAPLPKALRTAGGWLLFWLLLVGVGLVTGYLGWPVNPTFE
jgi:hypothetical protein